MSFKLKKKSKFYRAIKLYQRVKNKELVQGGFERFYKKSLFLQPDGVDC